jgi:adenylate cyclase
MDELEAAELLDGLEGAAREERARLLARLRDDGVSVAELRAATAHGTLVFLGADRLVGGGALYTPEEIAEQAGLDVDVLNALTRASGVAVPEPGERVLGPGDLELARIVRTYRDLGLPDEDLLDVTRVLARGLGQTAETMRQVALKQALRPGASEEDLAIDFTEVVARLMPLVEPMLGEMMRLQLRTMVRTEAINAAEREAGALPGAREVAVCFADLVGFTRVGEEVPPDELGQITRRLERLTEQALSPPVRFVKSIGDAVMLVSPDIEPLLDTALALVEATENEAAELPQLRVGVASGTALSRAADWYGRPVNLASRITAVARPGSVLAARPVHDALADGPYRWSFAGARRLKGIRDAVPLYRVRRLAATGEDPGVRGADA